MAKFNSITEQLKGRECKVRRARAREREGAVCRCAPDTRRRAVARRRAPLLTRAAAFGRGAAQVVLGVLGGAKSRVLKRWKLLDNSITDANNEAKDNVKYLSTLEKYIEPLRVGNPETILDSLPGLLNNIKMMVRVPVPRAIEERGGREGEREAATARRGGGLGGAATR
eukprot:1621542-Prymnesium_polylepis.2